MESEVESEDPQRHIFLQGGAAQPNTGGNGSALISFSRSLFLCFCGCVLGRGDCLFLAAASCVNARYGDAFWTHNMWRASACRWLEANLGAVLNGMTGHISSSD